MWKTQPLKLGGELKENFGISLNEWKGYQEIWSLSLALKISRQQFAPSNRHFTKKKTLGAHVETEWEISYDQLTTTRAL